MISKQLYKSFVFFNENKGSLYLEVEKIYKRFQQLRLEITGASWTLKSDKIYDVFDVDHNETGFIINKNRGCQFEFPIRWVIDPKWEKEAINGIKLERDANLLKIFGA
jgi:hypothetical protein